ncbi:hypothetical protein IW152_003822 [Coemansia sp. BCRC 34962]|nr:hypothetical protein IW152_003822 [Coemansia sp. BCRC 34962]
MDHRNHQQQQSQTIGRSQRGMDSMRGLREMLSQIEHNKEESSSDAEDIDNETAINTLYNLLSELGDLNRSNRRTAEHLSEKFHSLQAQLNHENNNNNNNNNNASPHSEDTFHTPSSDRGAADQRICSAQQTDLLATQMDQGGERLQRMEEENKALRRDVRILVAALREHQDMGKEYEATLARALVALRSAAFTRHLEMGDIQARYHELLTAEQGLNTPTQRK